MPRPQDPNVTDAALDATISVLLEVGYAPLTIAAVAQRAGIGKPAIYRRFTGKPQLVAAAVARALPAMTVPTRGSHRARMRRLIDEGLPQDADSYVALIGGLYAEHRRHPEGLAAFRDDVLTPRRALAAHVIAAAQEAGELRRDVTPEAAVDLLAGPFLARVFAGLDVGPRWRRRHLRGWWSLMEAR